MGRGGDQGLNIQKRSLGDLEDKTRQGLAKDLPSYVTATDFRPGFVVSFAHEARAGNNFELPRLAQEKLKSPALLLSFQVDKKTFLEQENIELEGENQDKLLAVYLSNRLLPLALLASGGRLIEGPAREDEQDLEAQVPLQNISLDKNQITYSVALS